MKKPKHFGVVKLRKFKLELSPKINHYLSTPTLGGGCNSIEENCDDTFIRLL